MCGIFAYTGDKKAAPILIEGLKTLEYRGYDSAGVYAEGIGCLKATGFVDNLKKKGDGVAAKSGTSGVAHTRWATHGEPTEKNAHPHSDCKEEIYLVHNGIIENYKEIKDVLLKKKHTFISETDSEVLVHLIEENFEQGGSFEQAVLKSLREVRGTYGIAVMHKKEPGKIVAARMGSPIAVGIGNHEHFIASDAAPILTYTKRVVYLNDGEAAVITNNSYAICTIHGRPVKREAQVINWDIYEVQKGGFDHFMLKEIMEAPEVVLNALRGRLLGEDGEVKLDELRKVQKKLASVKRIMIVACGTAYHAGMVAKYMIEEYVGLPVEVDIASEFRYRHPAITKDTLFLVISQSGETIDTLSALREAKKQRALVLGIVNVVGSTIARETDAVIYNHAGPEIGVASTKAFISQLTVLSLFTLYLGLHLKMSKEIRRKFASELLALPQKIRLVLDQKEKIKKIAEKYLPYKNFMFLGRKYNYPIAFEGALKLKEISYVHAEGVGAGEMKHGAIAMIDEQFPIVAIAPEDSVYEKMVSNIQEIKARRGRTFVITTVGNAKMAELADDVFSIPHIMEPLTPILSVIPLQLFAYYFAAAKGFNVDRPRNLAKSVTVE